MQISFLKSGYLLVTEDNLSRIIAAKRIKIEGLSSVPGNVFFIDTDKDYALTQVPPGHENNCTNHGVAIKCSVKISVKISPLIGIVVDY